MMQKLTAERRGANRKRRASDRGPAVIALPAQCLLPAIRGLHELLSPHLEAAAVMLDVSALQRIDTGSMQLIAAFALDRARAGRALERHGDSPAWDEAVRLLGMNSILPAQPHSPPQPHQRPMP